MTILELHGEGGGYCRGLARGTLLLLPHSADMALCLYNSEGFLQHRVETTFTAW